MTTEGIPTAFLAPIEDWEQLALCQETAPELFFPEKGESTRAAKAMPLKSAAAVTLGLVRPITCPACEGTGEAK